ncbi:sodium channel and clathrin linker 1-like [Hetaerina americana]|uniref:sodium channel and clathrin linker 1-like n=1 Tax=Hetaerina americana TaxID=62018 RepID=UPI003A7F3F8B
MEKGINREHGSIASKEELLSNEYDEILDCMIEQIDVFQDNVVKLKDKYVEVIKDNNELSNNLKEILQCKVNNRKTKDGDPDPLTVLANNLMQQLDLASQEKTLFVEFCEVVFKKMCFLEEKLVAGPEVDKHVEQSKAVMDGLQVEYSNVIRILEAQLNSLRALIAKEREKHEMLMTLHAEKAEKEYQKLCEEISEAKTREERAEKNEVAYLRDIAELKNYKERAGELLQEALKKEEIAVSQIEEALSVADTALREKDVAIMQQEIAHEELNQMRKTMAELVEDAGVRVKEEVDAVRKQFNLRIQEMIGEMALKEKEGDRLRQEWEECNRKRKGLEKCLERLAEKGVKGSNALGDSGPEVKIYEQQIRLLQQELSMEREGRKRLESEMMLLERRLSDIAGQQRRLDITEPVRAEREMDKKKHSVSMQLAQELKEQISRLENISAKDKVTVSAKENPAQVQKPVVVYLPSNLMKSTELHEIISSQLEMKQKWKQEANDLTFKLGKRIRELHAEVDKLKLENKELKLRLKKK